MKTKLNAATRLNATQVHALSNTDLQKGTKVVFTVTDNNGQPKTVTGKIIDGPWKPKAGTHQTSDWYRVRGNDNIRYTPKATDLKTD
jgi:ABC-type Mn2+/Zn2+ transport system ATPase subunit